MKMSLGKILLVRAIGMTSRINDWYSGGLAIPLRNQIQVSGFQRTLHCFFIMIFFPVVKMKNGSMQNALYPPKKINKVPKKKKFTLKTSGKTTLGSCGFLIEKIYFQPVKLKFAHP